MKLAEVVHYKLQYMS